MCKYRLKVTHVLIFVISIMLPAIIFSIGLAANQTLYLPIIFGGAPVEPAGVYIPHSSTAYVDSIGYLHIVGEVINSTVDNLQYVEINVNFFDQNDIFLVTDYTFTLLDNLPAYSKTCFHMLLPEPEGWSYYEFEQPIYGTDGSPLANLTVLYDNGSYNYANGEYEISGEVRNDQGIRVEYVTPVGTLYNAYNYVVGCDYTYVDSIHLEPNETSSFVLYFGGRDYYDVTRYRIQVEGDIQ